MDGLFLVALGVLVILVGGLRTAPRLLNREIPRSTGYLRGTEIGALVVTAIGALLVVIGVVAAFVGLLT